MAKDNQPDEIAENIIRRIKEKKLVPRNSNNQDFMNFVTEVQIDLAQSVYKRTGKDEALRELGLSYTEIGEVKRPRGKPSTNMYADKHIVQLVFKQQLQAGTPFTNSKSWENNPCFTAVADYQGRSVKQVYEQWKSVPSQERQKIKSWLEDILRKHGCLHKRHL